MSWIENKTVIVTGASSGIGAYIAAELVREYNCRVIGIGRDENAMKSMIKEKLTYYCDNFSYQLFDVSVERNWELFADYLARNDIRPDIIINNAGMLPQFNSFQNYTQSEIDKVFGTNVFGCMYAIRAVLPMLRESQTPGIINIASSSALAPFAGTSVYSASKAAVLNFTEGLIGELGRSIYIGVVCPGFSMTSIFRNQKERRVSRMIEWVSTSPEVMAHKIIKGINKQKHRMIIGVDAKLMNFFSGLCPILSLKVYEQALKISGIKMFEDVFKNKI